MEEELRESASEANGSRSRKCGLCSFTSIDAPEFGAHMRNAHGWDQLVADRSNPRFGLRDAVALLGGAILGVGVLFWQLERTERSCKAANQGAGWRGDVWFALFFAGLPAAVVGAVAVLGLSRCLMNRRARER